MNSDKKIFSCQYKESRHEDEYEGLRGSLSDYEHIPVRTTNFTDTFEMTELCILKDCLYYVDSRCH